MKHRNRGFTLVELLAVIVILALILAIAIPSVTTIVADAQKNTLANNAKVVLKSLKTDYDTKKVRSTYADTFILYDNGIKTTYPSGNNIDFSFSAKDGGIVIYNDGTINMAVYDGTYCATKLRNSNDIVITTTTKAACIANIYYKQASAPFVNLITNGNFSNGTTGWTAGSATQSVSNNTLINVGNGTAIYPQFQQSLGFVPTLGHKIYMKSKTRVTNSACTQITYMLSSSGMATQSSNIITTPLINTYYTDSKILTIATGATTPLVAYVYHLYPDNATANGKILETQDFMAINLSTTYGIGSEPTSAEMDNNINKVWIDSGTNIPKRFTVGGWINF